MLQVRLYNELIFFLYMKIPQNYLKVLILIFGMYLFVDGIYSIILQPYQPSYFFIARIIRSIIGIALIIYAFIEDDKIIMIK